MKEVKKVIDYIKPTCFHKFHDFFAGRKLNTKKVFSRCKLIHAKQNFFKKQFKSK